MTKYIDLLSEHEESLLLSKLGYSRYSDGFRSGSSAYYSEGYKIYRTYNHDYSSSKDYDDEIMYVSDFDVKYYNRKEKLETLYSFMYEKFGDEWAEKAIKYLNGKKAKTSVQFIENLVSQKNNVSKRR